MSEKEKPFCEFWPLQVWVDSNFVIGIEIASSVVAQLWSTCNEAQVINFYISHGIIVVLSPIRYLSLDVEHGSGTSFDMIFMQRKKKEQISTLVVKLCLWCVGVIHFHDGARLQADRILILISCLSLFLIGIETKQHKVELLFAKVLNLQYYSMRIKITRPAPFRSHRRANYKFFRFILN